MTDLSAQSSNVISEKKLSEMSEDEIAQHLEARRQARIAELNRTRPQVVEVLLKEGGQWIVWAPNEARLEPDHEKKGGYIAVHALKFADGSIWDVVNGWRT